MQEKLSVRSSFEEAPAGETAITHLNSVSPSLPVVRRRAHVGLRIASVPDWSEFPLSLVPFFGRLPGLPPDPLGEKKLDLYRKRCQGLEPENPANRKDYERGLF
jgi:hypothetical protein